MAALLKNVRKTKRSDVANDVSRPAYLHTFRERILPARREIERRPTRKRINSGFPLQTYIGVALGPGPRNVRDGWVPAVTGAGTPVYAPSSHKPKTKIKLLENL